MMRCERCSKEAPCVSPFGLHDAGWFATRTGWICDICRAVASGNALAAAIETCNVCGIKLKTDDEFSMGMCERCAQE